MLSWKTDRGVCFPLTRARTSQDRTKMYKEPRDSKDQYADQRDQDQAIEAGYRQEKGLLCRAGEPGKGRGHSLKQATKAPRQGLPGLAEAKPPHQTLYHDPRCRSVRCQAAKCLSGSHLPHGNHFLQEKPTNDTCPAMCQASRRGAGEIARQVLSGNQRCDVKQCI